MVLCFRIIFDYTIYGDANASVDVIRPDYQTALQSHNNPE